jgi:anti-sigma B factor antagonist
MFKRESSGPVEILRFQGNLDAAVSGKLRKDVKDIVASGRARLLFDLKGVNFIDSSGLSVFVTALNAARAAGGDVALLGLTKDVRSLIELTRLHRIFTIHEDEAAAIEQLSR